LDNRDRPHPREIADLLEIKGDNPFKIRAYRHVADIASNHPHELATLDEPACAKSPASAKTSPARSARFPQPVIPSFIENCWRNFPLRPRPDAPAGCRAEDGGDAVPRARRADARRSRAAALDGRVRAIKGMGAKKEALILKAIEERKSHVGRHLLSAAHDIANAIVALLRRTVPGGHHYTGRQPPPRLRHLRRHRHSRAGADPSIMDVFVEHTLVERVLARGDTKSSVLLRGGVQVDLRLVPPSSRGAALQYFTGSKSHNIALARPRHRARLQVE
jgi:DNA polymerase (family 10)